MAIFKDCEGIAQEVEIGAGKAKIKGVDANQLEVLKADGSSGHFKAHTLTVTDSSGITLSQLGVAVVDSLDSLSATDMLSAAQGKALGDRLSIVESTLDVDDASLDTAAERVAKIKDMADDIDAAEALIANNTATLLSKAGGIMHGGLTMQGQDIELIQGGKVKFSGGGLSADLFLNGSNYLEVSKDIYTSTNLRADGHIHVGGLVDGRDVALMGARQDDELLRKSTINKDSGDGDIGAQLSAGTLVAEVFAVVTEAFNNSATVEIGTADDEDMLGVLEASDLAVINKSIVLNPVKYFSSATQLQFKVNNGGSTGQVKVYIKPMV